MSLHLQMQSRTKMETYLSKMLLKTPMWPLLIARLMQISLLISRKIFDLRTMRAPQTRPARLR